VACAHAGDTAARDQLVTALQPFVRWVARGYENTNVDLDDLVQEGMIGLLRAIERFDPGAGSRLTTFAKPWVEGEIRRARRDAGLIRMPAAKAAELGRIVSAEEELRGELGREPLDQEVAAKAGMSVDEIRAAASLTYVLGGSDLEDSLVDVEPEADVPLITYSPEEVAALLLEYARHRGRVEGGKREGPSPTRRTSVQPTGGLSARLLDVEDALQRLPRDKYDAVEVVSFYGLSFAEAGTWLGVHSNTVRHRHRAAIAAVVDHLNGTRRLGEPRRDLDWRRELAPLESLRRVVRKYDGFFETLALLAQESDWARKVEVGWVLMDDEGWVPILSHDLEATIKAMRATARPLSEALGSS
jgi:RNA polymerase sigma factor (sigma-70 family)